MISKLAKNIAHFFVIQNITEESKEVIYAYGMELLISDVLNTIIVLLIALISHGDLGLNRQVTLMMLKEFTMRSSRSNVITTVIAILNYILLIIMDLMILIKESLNR